MKVAGEIETFEITQEDIARKQLWGFCESCHCQQVAICQDCKRLLKDVADDPNLQNRIRNANKVIEAREQTIKQLNAHTTHAAAIHEKALVEASRLDIDRIEQSWAYYQSIRTTAKPTIKIAKAKRIASLGFLANQIPKLVAEIRETRSKLAELKAALEGK